MKKRILFVDDERHVLDALRRMLRAHRGEWDITCIDHPVTAWNLLQESRFDAVVSDIQMPGMDGLELLTRIQQTGQTKDVPVVVLTGLTTRELKRRALELGATDLINKPVDPEDLIARLRSVLRLKTYQDQLRAQNELLEQKVRQRTAALDEARTDILWRLGKVAEHRDDMTGNHVIRVGCYSRTMAEVMGMDRDFIEAIFLSAPLHDIGKVGIPDAILFKRGSLTDVEWEIMQRHCEMGAKILRDECKAKSAFLQWRGVEGRPAIESERNLPLEMGASIALSHHEKWDGSGYPRGLRGNDIPIEARIVAIADVFDAMTTRRAYKDACSEEEALEVVREGEGSHFDPRVCSAFLVALPQIRLLKEQFADPDELPSPEEEKEHEANPIC